MLDNTAEELIQQVRDICDEDNVTDVTDPLILRMLNRAQQELVRTLTRHYKNHYMRERIYTGADLTADSNGQNRVLQVTSQAYGYAINQVSTKQGSGAWFPVDQVPFSYTLGLDNVESGAFPLQYAMMGNEIHLFPTPTSGTSIRVRYQFRAPKIVKSQGRITDYDADTETVILDALGSDLTTSTDNLGAFVNIIDHLTGEIKGTVQVSGITTSSKTLQIKTSDLYRSVVYGYTVGTTLPSTISEDDYICLASGTCVPLLAHDLTNYLVELAGFFTKRKLGTVDEFDKLDRDAIYSAIASSQFGREHTKKIQRRAQRHGFSWQPFFLGN